MASLIIKGNRLHVGLFVEKEERDDDDEVLEVDDDGYPSLPSDVLTFRLSKKKSVIRLYMGAVRRRLLLLFLHTARHDFRPSGYFQLNGRIPWTDIADNPSRYMNKRSRPHSDHKLIEPSHMKAQGVDDWLKHWLKLQTKGKRPLTLKDPSEGQATSPTPPSDRAKGKKSRKGKEKARDTPETSADEQGDGQVSGDDGDDNEKDAESGQEDDKSSSGENDQRAETVDSDAPGAENALGLPLAPSSAAKSKETRRAFLNTLSSDKNYRQLIRLLDAAKVNTHSPSHFHSLSDNLHQVRTSHGEAWPELGNLDVEDEFPSKSVPFCKGGRIAFEPLHMARNQPDDHE
jgi:hypothetical protein